jgi:hypothetical protein
MDVEKKVLDFIQSKNNKLKMGDICMIINVGMFCFITLIINVLFF